MNEQTPTEATGDGDAAPLLLTVSQVGRLLQLSPRSVWRLLSAGEFIEPVRLGGSVRWRRAEVDRWVAEGCPRRRAGENPTRR